MEKMTPKGIEERALAHHAKILRVCRACGHGVEEMHKAHAICSRRVSAHKLEDRWAESLDPPHVNKMWRVPRGWPLHPALWTGGSRLNMAITRDALKFALQSIVQDLMLREGE